MGHVFVKLLVFLVFIVVGFLLFILRKWTNRRALKRGQAVQEHFKNTIDPGELVENVTWVIFNKTMSAAVQTSEIRSLKENDRIGKMKILVNREVDHLKFMIATICEDLDYDLNAFGRFGGVKKLYQFNFIVEINEEEQRIRISSERYEDLNNKNLRTDFALRLLEMCTSAH